MVVSGVRGTVEMVDPDINAIVVEPGNSNALALALKTLIKSRQKRNDLGEEARKSVIQKFSLQASVTQLESLIQKIYAE
jgi:glycosyltransferase involved in cell wall biosynthesis